MTGEALFLPSIGKVVRHPGVPGPLADGPRSPYHCIEVVPQPEHDITVNPAAQFALLTADTEGNPSVHGANHVDRHMRPICSWFGQLEVVVDSLRWVDVGPNIGGVRR